MESCEFKRAVPGSFSTLHSPFLSILRFYSLTVFFNKSLFLTPSLPNIFGQGIVIL